MLAFLDCKNMDFAANYQENSKEKSVAVVFFFVFFCKNFFLGRAPAGRSSNFKTVCLYIYICVATPNTEPSHPQHQAKPPTTPSQATPNTPETSRMGPKKKFLQKKTKKKGCDSLFLAIFLVVSRKVHIFAVKKG